MPTQEFFNRPGSSPQRVLFVVDSPPFYSGNYERAMTAYVTGLVGDCGVGGDLAELAREEDPELCHELYQRFGSNYPDEGGVCRTCTIYPTPGYFSSAGTIYPDSEWGKPHIRRAQVKQARKEGLAPFKEVMRFAAYCSTAMFLRDVPPPEILERMSQRVLAFPKVFGGGWWSDGEELTITGIRVLREIVIAEQVTTCFPALPGAAG